MSDAEEDEDDMSDDKTSTCSGVVYEAKADGEADVVVAEGDGDGETREDEAEDSLDDFFDAGEGAVIAPAATASFTRRLGEGPKAAPPKTTPSVP